MRIRRPRNITVPQLMFVTAVGFLGGVYIWKPLILRYKADKQQQKEDNSNVKKESTTTVPLTSATAPTNPITETVKVPEKH